MNSRAVIAHDFADERKDYQKCKVGIKEPVWLNDTFRINSLQEPANRERIKVKRYAPEVIDQREDKEHDCIFQNALFPHFADRFFLAQQKHS